MFHVVESTLEDGSSVADLCLSTESCMLPVWAAPTTSTAANAAYLLNAVYAKLVACGSNQEVARLLDKVLEALDVHAA